MMQRLAIVLSTAIVVALAFVSSAICAAEQNATKYVRFEVDGQAAYGIIEGEQVRRLKGCIFTDPEPTETCYRLSDVKVLVPTEPSKVLAIAGNYMSHFSTADAAAEREHKPPEPFFKVPSCLIAQGEKIVLPKGSKDVHFEAELVVVIGKRARNVSVEKALDFVLGVTCGDDVSARDWQKNDVQWWRAKGHDTFGPCGPYIVSGIDYNNLMVRLRLNGEVKQEQSTCDMMNNVAQIVSFASRYVTLLPGDLIYTGTPGKTSAIKPGDVVEVDIEGVGVLRNEVTAAK